MPEFAIIAELTVAYKLNDIISAVGYLKTVSENCIHFIFKTAFPTYPLDYVLAATKKIAKNQNWIQEYNLTYGITQKSVISTDGTRKNKTPNVKNVGDHGNICEPQYYSSCFWLDKLHC